ncbi:MAG TPA: aminopeptidase N [Marmoricola sp.]|nr:aminopeptidase N [Marmoricola sp.]
MTDQIASLTHHEAVARAALLDVDRYDINLDMTGLLEGDTLRSTVVVRFGCSRPGAETFIDCVADIESATLNGAPLDVAAAARGRLPLSDLRADNELVVTARQSDTASSAGIQRVVDPRDKQVYVWTSFEPDDARRVWACFDQPDLKAVHAFTVTAPGEWTVLSNTGPVAVEDCPGGRRWVFEDTPRLSPYVVVVNAGPFHEIRSERGGYDLGLYCRQSLVPVLERDAEELFAVTAHGLAWFGEKFELPFPQRRYDQAFVPDMAGAMENWGAITHSDDMLSRTAPTTAERTYRAYVVLHEMAHQWFGDLVTMRWWDDVWLNEAFATWAGTWAQAAMPEFPQAWASELFVDTRRAYLEDLAPSRHSVRADVEDVAAAMARFDMITYGKGMAALKQLVAYVGEEAFVTGLRDYFHRHAWGNTELADLMEAVGKAAGEDLTDWTRAWLDRPGTDVISLDAGTVHVAGPDGTPPCPHRFDIASFDDGGRLLATTPVRADGGAVTVELPRAAAHLLNVGDHTFAATRPDAVSRAWLRGHADRLPDGTARTRVVLDVWDEMVRDEAAGADLVDCVVTALTVERDPTLVELFLDLALDAAELWTPRHDVAHQKQRLADTALALADEVAQPALRLLALCASTDEHFARLAESTASDQVLQWRVLARRAEVGEYDADEAAAAEARDPDPDAAVWALAVRAARPEVAAKEEAWQPLMVERAIARTEARRLLTRMFWRPAQADLLRPFADRYLEVMRGFDGGMLSGMSLIADMFPDVVGDEDFLVASAAVTENDAVMPLVRQGLMRGNDVLARQLRARRA